MESQQLQNQKNPKQSVFPDLRSGVISHISNDGLAYRSNIKSYCKYISREGGKSYFLSSLVKTIASAGSPSIPSQFFKKLINNEDTIEHVLITDESASTSQLSRPDKIFSVRDEFEQMRLREIRDNYLIPEPVSIAHCLKTEIRYRSTEVIHLSDIMSLITNQLDTPIHAEFTINSASGSVHIISVVKSIFYKVNPIEKSDKELLFVSLGTCFIPMLEYPYYGEVQLAINSNQADSVVSAIIPSYHADPSINPLKTLRSFNLKIEYPSQARLFVYKN